jgi:hypothetical protein
MTVQEFYDDLAKRQSQEPGNIHYLFDLILHFIIKAPSPKPIPLSDEHLNEIDDPTHRETVRQTDEYKDDNPRGSGNRYNRS